MIYDKKTINILNSLAKKYPERFTDACNSLNDNQQNVISLVGIESNMRRMSNRDEYSFYHYNSSYIIIIEVF